MNKKSLSAVLSLLAATAMAIASTSVAETIKPMKRVLWTDTPLVVDAEAAKMPRRAAGQWESSVYPIGNGRLGCTAFGEPRKERIQFNEDSLWVGNEDCTGGYQPFGDVYVEMPHAEFSDYRRELDISRAVQTITYKSGGVGYKREYFSSHPAQVMVFRFSADKKAALSGKISMGNEHEIPIAADNGILVMKGDTSKFWWWQVHLREPKRLLASREYASDKNIDLDFEARVRVLHEGGAVKTVDNTVVFENCDSVILLLAADTNYLNRRDKGWRGPHPHERVSAQIAAAEKRPYAALLGEHVADYQSLYGRVSINLGDTPAAVTALPTSKRVKAYSAQARQKGGVAEDRDLEALLYQYARYLMLSCSRPGEGALPANLQGLWLISRAPAWRCDYHTDVNLQMNYWFTEPANLAECFVPVAEWIDSIREVRKEETRKVLKVKRGWLMRSENGVFGGSTWYFQKGDSAWLCQNLWDHYAFTQDRAYLERYAYPVMKEISEFWVDHLKALPDGTLVVPDGRSPEHGPEKSDGVSYDQQLCWDLFSNVIEAGEALGVDVEYRKELLAKRAKLLGPKIGKWGQLQEWMEDIDDPKDTHRHISHLIAVYPGRQIHPNTTPKLAEAAKVSVIARGTGGTGWSMAWRINVFARLLDGQRAYAMLSTLMASKVQGNLWTTHPPFQIDANFGYAAGVNEMLVQSHMGIIHLLPALPKAWSTGSVKGLRARGGYELDMEWKDGKLTQAVVRGVSNGPGKCVVRYGKNTNAFALARGESRVLLVALKAAAAEVPENLYPSEEQRQPSPGHTTYHIDPAEGDDAKSGLAPKLAWRTFRRVNQLRLAPGDRVEIITPGAFDQTLMLAGAGTAEAPVEVRFAPGRYDFHPDRAFRDSYQISNTNDDPEGRKAVGILLAGASHFRISGPGASLFYRGKMIEVCIDRSEDITLSGLQFDYHRPTVSEFRVAAVGDGYIDLQIHKDSCYTIKNGTITWQGEGWSDTTGLAQELDLTTNEVRRRRDPLKGLALEEIKPFLVRARGRHDMKPQRVYQIRATRRDCAGVFVQRSRNITWKDVKFRFLHGMGMVNQFSENLTFDSVTIAPDKSSGRTTAAWADCLQVSGCRGKVLVKDCVFSGAHDDAINIHGTYLRVVERLPGGQVKVRFMQHQTFGFLAFNPGDEIEFVHWDSLATYGPNRVKEARLLAPMEVLLTLEKPVPDEFRDNDVLENVTWTPEVEIRGCNVSRIPTRGFLVTTRRRALIEDNEFLGTHMSAILVGGDARGWYESGCVRDMTIRGNRFIRCGEPVVHIDPQNTVVYNAVHRNIRIENNQFILRGTTSVKAASTSGLRVAGNTIRSGQGSDDTRSVQTSNCADVQVGKNTYLPLSEQAHESLGEGRYGVGP